MLGGEDLAEAPVQLTPATHIFFEVGDMGAQRRQRTRVLLVEQGPDLAHTQPRAARRQRPAQPRQLRRPVPPVPDPLAEHGCAGDLHAGFSCQPGGLRISAGRDRGGQRLDHRWLARLVTPNTASLRQLDEVADRLGGVIGHVSLVSADDVVVSSVSGLKIRLLWRTNSCSAGAWLALQARASTAGMWASSMVSV